MSIKPVKVGILGYGHYMRITFTPAFKKCSSLEVAGVYNRGEPRRKLAEEDGYFATSSLDELLAIPGLEGVVIGTANAAHKYLTLKCAAAGKHIICEKPLALGMDDVNEMVGAVKKADLITHVNYSGIYNPPMVKFQELIPEKAGVILHFWQRNSRNFGLWSQGARHGAVGNPEDSGGWTFHHECHFLNNACRIVGSKAVKVYHTIQKSCKEAPSEEIVNTIIHFENGATACLADGLTIGGFCDMGAFGTMGDLRLLGNTITSVTPGESDPLQRPGNLSPVVEKIEVTDKGKSLITVGHKFAEAIRGGQNDLLSFETVAQQYKILYAMKKSGETGEVVEIK
ncbi:MAG: Gfo/Idh/MocA family oxidoreductase [bacterium]